MAVLRRQLLTLAIAPPLLAAAEDSVRGERGMGSDKARQTAVECFSLTCPHCAEFALQSLPEIRTRFIAPGRLRWVFYDFPTDKAALQAAMVARYLPVERYPRFIDTLFENQDRWVFGAGSVADSLWLLAGDAGMDRATFARALDDAGLQDWIVQRALTAEQRWRVTATPSFIIDGKLHSGAMSAGQFATILGS
jgi:protein-disulfide isomerase